MIRYLIKYYTAITIACIFPIMVILGCIPDQTFYGAVTPSIKWAGLIGAFLTWRLFTSKNYWVLFYNLKLHGLKVLITVTIIYEIAVFIIGIWLLKV